MLFRSQSTIKQQLFLVAAVSECAKQGRSARFTYSHLVRRDTPTRLSRLGWQPKHGRERFVSLCSQAIEIAERAFSASAGPWLLWLPTATPRKLAESVLGD